MKLLNKRPRPKLEYCNNSVIFEPILMKFCMQLSYGPQFPVAKFQQGHKGQRPEGRKVKGQIFKKLAEAISTTIEAVCKGLTSTFVLKHPILEDLASEPRVLSTTKLETV